MNTLQNLIKKHKFDWVNSNITSAHFPDSGERGKDYKLFHFDKQISSEDVIKEIEKENYRPCNLYELLEWKDWNGEDTVVALGSVWRDFGGSRRVACLYSGDSERRLSLGVWDGDWDGYYRFLAVRKSGTPTLVPSDNVLERLADLEIFKSKVEKVLKV